MAQQTKITVETAHLELSEDFIGDEHSGNYLYVQTCGDRTGVRVEQSDPKMQSFSVFHRRAYEFRLPNFIDHRAWNSEVALQADSLLPAIQYLLDHTEIHWDGSNHVGRLDLSAWPDTEFSTPEEAVRAIIQEIEDDVQLTVEDAADWAYDHMISSIDAQSTDAEIADWARWIRADARSEGIHLLDDDLEGMAQRHRDEADPDEIASERWEAENHA